MSTRTQAQPHSGAATNQKSVQIAQGNGGLLTRELIESLFLSAADKQLDTRHDSATVACEWPYLCMTTDSFVVTPAIFPGGNVGSLSVYGTVNDLAVVGATPKYISTAFILEEGFPLETLETIVNGLYKAASETGVSVITGDTKVVPKNAGGGVYITSTGIGYAESSPIWDSSLIREGDVILVSGTIGDHGATVMLAREEFGLGAELKSDCASVLPLVALVKDLEGVRFLRDPTRGGLSVLLHDIVQETGFDIQLDESKIPIRPEVESVCDILGLDPHVLACEGRLVAVVSPEISDEVLNKWRNLDCGRGAENIGMVKKSGGSKGRVLISTSIGGCRMMNQLEEEPLPRIC
ncbi:hydrogenase expression/formation protein HypE [Alteromonas mediterranea]|uniref:hydrogenase expression/formation protein HypE n=1 Tax=Alteromonas mediterranea TaxID=314275 RepID=UPI002FE079F0